MVLDVATVRNLELTDPLFAGESRQSTLLYVIDQTTTGMGGLSCASAFCNLPTTSRRSKRASTPSRNWPATSWFAPACAKRSRSILDLERLLARITLATAGPRELLALAVPLRHLPAIEKLAQHSSRRLRQPARSARRPLRPDSPRIADDPPVSLADGGAIRDGYHAELDQYRDIAATAASTLPPSNPASGPRRYSKPRSASTTFSASILRCRRPISTSSRPTSNAARRLPTPSASLPLSCGGTRKRRCSPPSTHPRNRKGVFSEIRALAPQQATRIQQLHRCRRTSKRFASPCPNRSNNRYARPRFSDLAKCVYRPGAVR